MNNSFLGTGWSFPPEFSLEKKDVVLVTEKEDIEQSLMIILSTRQGERVLHPLFGCNIYDLVFETMNERTKTLAKEAIQQAILFFEPRITLENVKIERADIKAGVLPLSVAKFNMFNRIEQGNDYDGTLLIYIDYTIRTTNTRSNIVFPFYIKEGTLLETNTQK
jgi:hypothetical protein